VTILTAPSDGLSNAVARGGSRETGNCILQLADRRGGMKLAAIASMAAVLITAIV